MHLKWLCAGKRLPCMAHEAILIAHQTLWSTMVVTYSILGTIPSGLAETDRTRLVLGISN
jgi:hypothetical protein